MPAFKQEFSKLVTALIDDTVGTISRTSSNEDQELNDKILPLSTNGEPKAEIMVKKRAKGTSEEMEAALKEFNEAIETPFSELKSHVSKDTAKKKRVASFKTDLDKSIEGYQKLIDSKKKSEAKNLTRAVKYLKDRRNIHNADAVKTLEFVKKCQTNIEEAYDDAVAIMGADTIDLPGLTKIAKNASLTAKTAKKTYDSNMKPYFQDRNGLNFSGAKTKFSLAASQKKAYSVELEKMQTTFVDSINKGSESLGICKEIVDTNDQIKSIFVQCKDIVAGGGTLKEKILQDITSKESRKGTMGTIWDFAEIDQNSVKHMHQKITGPGRDLIGMAGRYAMAKSPESDELTPDQRRILQNIEIRWVGLLKHEKNMPVVVKRIEKLFNKARSRVPASVIGDSEIQNGFGELQKIINTAKDRLEEANKTMEEARRTFKKVKIKLK